MERALLLFLLFALVWSCADSADEAAPATAWAEPAPLPAQDELQLELALADFAKPRMGSGGRIGIDDYMAPLIYREVEVPGAPVEHLGALFREPEGGLGVDLRSPTLYAAQSQVTLNGHEHRRIEFLWFIAGASGEPVVQGVRTTFDDDGFPAILEVLASREGRELVYVTKKWEDAARRGLGEPLPGRRHAIERGLEEWPRGSVARILADGPTPMGPFVYVRARAGDVATVHCRCSPSQVREIRATVEYELVPFDALRDFGIDAPAWSTDLLEPGRAPLDTGEREAADRLARRLRLPESF